MPVWNTLPTDRDHVLPSSCLSYPTKCLCFKTPTVGNGHTVLHNGSCLWRHEVIKNNEFQEEKQESCFIKVREWWTMCYSLISSMTKTNMQGQKQKSHSSLYLRTPVFLTVYMEKVTYVRIIMEKQSRFSCLLHSVLILRKHRIPSTMRLSY